MQFAVAALALASGLSLAAAQGSQGSCSPDFPTAFTFQTLNATGNSKRSIDEELIEKRQSISCGSSVTLHLGGGVLNDARGRTGYIASNDQFQFDAPPQAGYKQTSGWSVCTLTAENQRLTLDGNQIFYNCLSGTFNNIYTSKQGAQCYEVYIQVFGCIPSSQIPTAPINSVPFPSGSLSAGASESEAPSTSVSYAPATTQAMSYEPLTSMPSAFSVATPYPAGNSTSAAATATGVTTAAVSTPAVVTPGSPSKASTPPSAFTGAANVVAAGQKVVGVVAGLAAYAML